MLNVVYFVPQEHQHSLTSTHAGSSWNQRQLVKRNYSPVNSAYVTPGKRAGNATYSKVAGMFQGEGQAQSIT